MCAQRDGVHRSLRMLAARDYAELKFGATPETTNCQQLPPLPRRLSELIIDVAGLLASPGNYE